MMEIVNTNGSADLEQAAVETMLGRQIEGLLFASMHTRAVTLPAGVRDVATVLVNCFTEDRDGHHTEVLPDDRTGGRDAVEILLSAGHTRVAVINGDHGTHAWIDRTAGARDAFAARDMELPDDLVIEGNWLPDGGYDITRALFSRSDPPTALVCANDRTALGAYDALRELGLSIPADVSVVGYDDQEISRFLRPPLTTIALPHYELGRRACQLLLSGPRTSTRELVACPPRVRNSVAPPRL